MKHHSTALLIAALVATGTLCARAEVYELSTNSGKAYHQCRVLKIELDGVSFKHDKGTAKVLFKDLTPKWREHFGYDAEKVKAHEAKLKEDKARAQAAAVKRAQEIAKARQEAMSATLEQQTLLALRNMAVRGGGYAGSGWSDAIALTGALPFVGNTTFGYGANGFHTGRHGPWSPQVRKDTPVPSGSTGMVTVQEVVNGRRYYVTKRNDWNGRSYGGNAWNARPFSTACAPNSSGFTPQPFFAVPGIGPNVAR